MTNDEMNRVEEMIGRRFEKTKKKPVTDHWFLAIFIRIHWPSEYLPDERKQYILSQVPNVSNKPELALRKTRSSERHG